MAKRTMLKWLQRGWETFIDPERQSRVSELAEYLRRCIAKEKKEFSLKAALQGHEFDPEDVRLARLAVYRTYADRALLDGALTDAERSSLNWASCALELTDPELIELHQETGRKAFGKALAAAIDDGHIDEVESQQIQSLAAFMGQAVTDVMRDYFCKEGEHFLSSVFLSATEDGTLLKDEWARFLASAQRLGFSRAEAVGLIRPHARRFVEHVLADAKSDERITNAEESNLKWLMTELAVQDGFRRYVETEINGLRLMDQICAGRLPSLNHRIPVELRAGELVHFFGPARFQKIKQLRSGPRLESYEGNLAITDSRLIFDSPLCPFDLNLRKVISISRDGHRVCMTATPKATGFYDFGEQSKIAGLILAVAVGKANQTIVAPASGAPTRHIPRDVRQRVWQRYGGRCVDCGASDYLEFDHIIPVAKGGNNDERNVQLLCRRCNLAKSDQI